MVIPTRKLLSVLPFGSLSKEWFFGPSSHDVGQSNLHGIYAMVVLIMSHKLVLQENPGGLQRTYINKLNNEKKEAMIKHLLQTMYFTSFVGIFPIQFCAVVKAIDRAAGEVLQCRVRGLHQDPLLYTWLFLSSPLKVLLILEEFGSQCWKIPKIVSSFLKFLIFHQFLSY